MNASQAIARSISHNESVIIEVADASVNDDLEAECQGSVFSADGAHGTSEYWGTTDAREEWRVYVRADWASR